MYMLDKHFYQENERTSHIYDGYSYPLIACHLHINNAGIQQNDIQNKLVIQEYFIH